MDFQEIKNSILQWAKDYDACSGEYLKAESASNDAELLAVITHNWFWVWDHNLPLELLEAFGEESLKQVNIVIVRDGVFKAVSQFVRADGNSTVEATNCATINSYNKNGHTVNQFAICRYASYLNGKLAVEFKMPQKE